MANSFPALVIDSPPCDGSDLDKLSILGLFSYGVYVLRQHVAVKSFLDVRRTEARRVTMTVRGGRRGVRVPRPGVTQVYIDTLWDEYGSVLDLIEGFAKKFRLVRKTLRARDRLAWSDSLLGIAKGLYPGLDDEEFVVDLFRAVKGLDSDYESE